MYAVRLIIAGSVEGGKVHLRNLDGWRGIGYGQFLDGSISSLGFGRFALRMLGCIPFFRYEGHMFTAEVVPDDYNSLLISCHINTQFWELITNLFLVLLGNYDDACARE